MAWYESVFLGTLGLRKQLGTTPDERDALELCRINSEIAFATVWICKRLDFTKEEIVAVDRAIGLRSYACMLVFTLLSTSS